VNTITPFLRTTLHELAQTEATARSLIQAEKKKIPPDILKGQSGKVIEMIEKHLDGFAGRNAANVEASKTLLPKAETLVQ
jgi:hypothetical protein